MYLFLNVQMYIFFYEINFVNQLFRRQVTQQLAINLKVVTSSD